MQKGYLILENGTVFEGDLFGYIPYEPIIGELVFTTGMCGYIETITDPSYFGQIVIQTFPEIGNYGIIDDDFEGRPFLSGYVMRNLCEHPSNYRCDMTLEKYFEKNKKTGICNIDTRAVTKIIREKGVMNAAISLSSDCDIDQLKAYRIKDAVKTVSHKQVSIFEPKQFSKTVVLMDFGVKNNIIRELNKRNCKVISVPYNTTSKEIREMRPDGIVLSNGPGDPEDNVSIIEQIKQLIGDYPMMGICLGHQLMALALGGKTIKLKYGHRGANQPVKYIKEDRTFITSQNHGYAVVAESVSSLGKEIFKNINDGTCEGISYEKINAFSVQFHPEACAGPQDTSFLFDNYLKMLK